MPGLLRGMVRTAAVVGTAGAVSHRQQQRWANQEAQQQATQQPVNQPVAQNDNSDMMAELQQLAQLKDQGILTQEEFEAKKKQVLGI